MRLHRNFLAHIICGLAILSMTLQPVFACTGITLKAKDGAVVFGRTMEWGSFDLKSRLIIVPRGHKFTSLLDDHKPGLAWTAKHGVAGIDAVGKDVVVDGMNEEGLQVSLFYHPGTSQYQKFELAKIGESLAPTDVGTYLLTTCASVEEVELIAAGVGVPQGVTDLIGGRLAVIGQLPDRPKIIIVVSLTESGQMQIVTHPSPQTVRKEMGIVPSRSSMLKERISTRHYGQSISPPENVLLQSIHLLSPPR